VLRPAHPVVERFFLSCACGPSFAASPTSAGYAAPLPERIEALPDQRADRIPSCSELRARSRLDAPGKVAP